MDDGVCINIDCKNALSNGDFHDQCLYHRPCIEKCKLLPCKLCEQTFKAVLNSLDFIHPINNVWNNMISKLKKKRRKIRGDGSSIWSNAEDEIRFTLPVKSNPVQRCSDQLDTLEETLEIDAVNEEALMLEIQELNKEIEQTQNLPRSNKESSTKSEKAIEKIADSRNEEALMLEIQELNKEIEQTQNLPQSNKESSTKSEKAIEKIANSRDENLSLSKVYQDFGAPRRSSSVQHIQEDKIIPIKKKDTRIPIKKAEVFDDVSTQAPKAVLVKTCEHRKCGTNIAHADRHPGCWKHRSCFVNCVFIPCNYCSLTFNTIANCDEIVHPRKNVWINYIRKLKEKRLTVLGDDNIFRNEEEEKLFSFPVQYSGLKCLLSECRGDLYKDDCHPYCIAHRSCIDEYCQLNPCEHCVATFKAIVNLKKVYQFQNVWTYNLNIIKQYRLKTFNDTNIWKYAEDEEFFNLEDVALYLHFEVRETELESYEKRRFLRLYVGQLSPDTTAQRLKDHFEQFGEIMYARIEEYKTYDGGIGFHDFGFVTCGNPDIAQKALNQEIHIIDNTEICVMQANSFEERRFFKMAKKQTDEAQVVLAFSHVYGTFNVTRLAAQLMHQNEPNSDGQRGVIINTGSLSSEHGLYGQSGFAAAKGAIAAMTLPIARDLSTSGIRVVTISPGLFETPLTSEDCISPGVRSYMKDQCLFPRRFGYPDEFAKMVESVVMNPMLNAENIRLNGGLRFFFVDM